MDREIITPSWRVSQKPGELKDLQEFLKDYDIKKILEIGTWGGGTALLWAMIVAPSKGRVFCADLNFDKKQAYANTPYEQYITRLQGDTHDGGFIKKVCMNIGEIDLLFIDGDHSYKGVKQDFDNYYQLVKKGGYVIFHDILESKHHQSIGCNVSQFWNEIKCGFPYWEFFDTNAYKGIPADCMGIGIIKL